MSSDELRKPQIVGHGAKFGRKKESAILALMSCPSVEAAAVKIKISPSTLKRWMAQSDFSREYLKARRDAMVGAVGILSQSCVRASLVLDSIARNKKQPPAARVSAARAIILLAMKSTELIEMEERLAKLEKLIRDKGGDIWPAKIA